MPNGSPSVSRRERPPVRARLRSHAAAEAVEPADGLASAANDLRQFDERSVSQGRATRVRRCRVRNYGERRLARVSGSHQAQLPHARVCQRALRGPTCAGPHMDGGLGRGRHQAVESPAPWRHGCTGALSISGAPNRVYATTRSRWHPLDHRGRREWSRGTANASRLGPSNQELLRGSEGPFLFQAMGRASAEIRGTIARRRRVE